MPSKSEVIPSRKDDDGAENHNTPVHGGGCDGRCQREERKDEDWREEAQCEGVDESTVSAQRPAAVWQRFAADALQEDATDRDRVGSYEGGYSEGNDCLQSHGGADVDER